MGAIQKIAAVYKTPSWGFEGDEFLNTCIKVSTYQAPEKLLQTLLAIEKKLGRTRKGQNEYQNRPIDIDVLLFDDEIIFSRTLTVPHPKMLLRKFVMVPLNEIASTFIHPITKNKIEICLQNCEDTLGIEMIPEKLIRPIPLSEKYNYIAIEGNIGAGKTSLANLLSDQFNAKSSFRTLCRQSFFTKVLRRQRTLCISVRNEFSCRQISAIE